MARREREPKPLRQAGDHNQRFGQQSEQRGWVWYTAASAGDPGKSSAVFDFAPFFRLRDNQGRYDPWYDYGLGIGLVGDDPDSRPWRARAVTFFENHDTGYRTNEDGAAQLDHGNDSFSNGWRVEQAYAQILTHPGVPTVFWKHHFDWGQNLQDKIKALINARKVAGITSGSELDLQNNARQRGVYGARVVGRNGDLFVRVGGDDSGWNPADSGYQDYREYASGAGWRVWVRLNSGADNAVFQPALLKGSLPIPQFQTPAEIVVPDEALQ